MYRQAHKLGNLDATINLAFHFLNDTHPSTHQALARLGFENGRAISKALLKYAYRRGKVDALDFLCHYELIRSRDELLTEIVQDDEQGGMDNTEMQTMAQFDALPPLGQKSLSSSRPVYPS